MKLDSYILLFFMFGFMWITNQNIDRNSEKIILEVQANHCAELDIKK